MEKLFAAVRAACLPAVWNRAVELTRTTKIVKEAGDGAEFNFRVTGGTGPVSPRGTLWLDDACWSCDCTENNDPCSHVAAAAIALKNGEVLDSAVSSPARVAGLTLIYSFERADGRLHFHRLLRGGEKEQRLSGSLRAYVGGVASGRIRSLPVSASQADYTVDAVIQEARDWQPGTDSMRALLACLHGLPNVELDGETVHVRRDPLSVRAIIEDGERDGVILRREFFEQADEIFQNGVGRIGDVLRPLARQELPQALQVLLAKNAVFGPRQFADLLSDIIPELRRHLAVEVRSSRLPKLEKMPLRIVLETEGSAAEGTLHVQPRIIYGGDREFILTGQGFTAVDGVPEDCIPLRDRAKEQTLERDLRLELHLSLGRSVSFREQEAFDFLRRAQDWEVRGPGAREFAIHGPVRVVSHWDGETFGLACVCARGREGNTNEARVSYSTLVRAWQEGRSLLALPGGGYGQIPAEFLARYAARLEALLQASEIGGKIRGAAILDALAVSEELGGDAPSTLKQMRARLLEVERSAEFSSPLDPSVRLRNYQQHGASWLSFIRDLGFGGMLADDMGLGKTIQMIAALKAPCLVVTPTSVLSSWTDQLRRFRPAMSVELYTGPKRSLAGRAEVYLTTYGILRLDCEALAKRQWEVVVLDESQQIKNPDSQVAQAACRLRSRSRFALTGTPLENRLDELWSQFHFLNPGLPGTREDFQQRFVTRADDVSREQLQKRVRPLILRRLKQDVAPELPPRTNLILHCELSQEEDELYQSLLAATRKEVRELLKEQNGLFGALERLLRLRQACCHPSLVPGSSAESSSKIELLLDVVEQAKDEGHRALVFSQWTSLLDLVEPQLRSRNISFERLDGTTRDREGVVRRFQESDGPPVLLLSLKAGGSGITLTGADHVFLLDPWWNPAVEDQAADRAHRIGQQRPVMIYRLIARNTVEEKILELQDSKRALLQSVMSGQADRSHALSREDILRLLE
jgi:hypothetical protein